MKFHIVVFVSANLMVAAALTTYKTIPDPDSDPYKEMPPAKVEPKENGMDYWKNQAASTLKDKTERTLNTNRAKNIIFFLGDGMSIPTVTAARIYKGQLKNKAGEEEKLTMETFPYTGLSKTYCVDRQVSDSAATATAYLTGVKANIQTIGVSAQVHVADCESAKLPQNRPSSIAKWAQDAKKATGIVTTARVTHASPAGVYAHVPYRDMESDGDVKRHGLDPTSCDFDIAKQLVFEDPGRNLNVIMGGGLSKFLKPEGSKYGKGNRLDQDLVEEWRKDKASRNANGTFVTNVNELQQVDESKTDYLLGLFSAEHMGYHTQNRSNEPTLEYMTEKAIKMLKKNPNGFFLFVEGGKIDMAHHEDRAHVALDETVEFDKAIEKAYQMTNEEDTLIVVTADHSHTMTINGYPVRGNNILGLFGKSNDSLPYATLSYANGPGYREEIAGKRHNLDEDDRSAHDYVFPAMVPKKYETHGGDDVAVFASGPWSHLFSGTYEQNFIPIAEAYAAKIGPSAQSSSILLKASSSIIVVGMWFTRIVRL